jgi:hypothetical protein
MLRYIVLLIFLFNVHAMTCPPKAGLALLERNRQDLLACDSFTLRKYYNDNGCCITNIAECNYIEKAWWMRVNIINYKPLCEYHLRHPEHIKHLKRRSFLKRIKSHIFKKTRDLIV